MFQLFYSSLTKHYVICLVTLILHVLIMKRTFFHNAENNIQQTKLKVHKYNKIDKQLLIKEPILKPSKVIYWITTHPGSHKTKVIDIKQTWATHCKKVLYMSTTEDSEVPTIALKAPEGRRNLWAKTKAALLYLYQNHIHDSDWFFKADDDTFIIPEHANRLLPKYNSSKLILLGCKLKVNPKTREPTFMSGGAGYIMSKAALIRFVEIGLFKKVCNTRNSGVEDVLLGICAEKLEIEMITPLDKYGKSLFLPMTPEEQYLMPSSRKWFPDMITYNYRNGSDCCSNQVISFHHILPHQMHLLYYLVYKVRPNDKHKEKLNK